MILESRRREIEIDRETCKRLVSQWIADYRNYATLSQGWYWNESQKEYYRGMANASLDRAYALARAAECLGLYNDEVLK